MQVRADDLQSAMRLSTEALSRASAAATAAGAGSRLPEFEHAEIDRVAIPA